MTGDWGRRHAWWLLPLAFFLMCAGWAVSSPVGSSPDDDFHLTSIWCAAGECSPSANGSAVTVRGDVVGAADCYRYESTVGAACTDALTDAPRVTDRANQVQGIYPDGFYRAMAVLAGPDVERSVVLMRLANAAIAALVLAAVLALTPAGIASAAMAAMLVTFVPLGLFITASTNPSAWAVVAIPGFWALALAWLRAPTATGDRRAWALAAGTLVTTLLALGSRVDASAYLVLAVAIVVVLGVSGREHARQVRGRLAVLALVAVAGALNYLAISSTSHAEQGVDAAFQGTAEAGVGLLLTNLVQLPVLVQGILGSWGLGWNDTPMPPLVWFTGTVVLGAALYRGLAELRGRRLVAAGMAAAALVVVPIGFLQVQRLGVGELVQPRYLLPLLTLLVATVSLGPDLDRPLALPRVPAILGAVAVSASAILAWWANVQRYLVGTGEPLFDRTMTSDWSLPLGLPLAAALALTVLSTVGFVGGTLWAVLGRSAVPAPPDQLHLARAN